MSNVNKKNLSIAVLSKDGYEIGNCFCIFDEVLRESWNRKYDSTLSLDAPGLGMSRLFFCKEH
jgi:hypothetical protein